MSAFIDQARARYGVEPICRTLGVSASAHYQRGTGERSARSVEDERLVARIREVHEENFECYGYPRVWHELRRRGEQVGRDRVARLTRQEGIRGAKRRGKPWRTTVADPNAEKRPDLVERHFTADAPDRLWAGDLTYLRTWEGRMYFAFLIDVFSRMIVGRQIASHMRTDLVLDALRMALGTRQPGAEVQLVQHTDQGSQYTAEDYTQELDDHRVLAFGRQRRGLLRQRARRIVRRQLQDRADRRPRVAHQRAAQDRDRRLRRLVQPPPAALPDRKSTARRTRTRLLDAPRARVPTVAGSGRPNSH